MEEIRDIAVYEPVAPPMDIKQVKTQVATIQMIMKEVMHEGEHFGVIPGTSGKPSLLKPGAEKLNLTFRMSPTYQVDRRDMGNGHIEYVVTCTLKSIGSDVVLGQGVGSCSTLEGKYRYRTGPKESTGKPVPAAYWDKRKSDPTAAQELLGGKGFSAMKENGKWVISVQGEKVEHDNPADYYNTVLKMAKKRAHVDAVLTVTAASDIFTQDIEDMPEVIPGAKQQEKEADDMAFFSDPIMPPKQSKRVKDMIASIGNKLSAAEKFLGKKASEWTDADVDKVENAKKKKSAPSLASEPAPGNPMSDEQFDRLEGLLKTKMLTWVDLGLEPTTLNYDDAAKLIEDLAQQ